MKAGEFIGDLFMDGYETFHDRLEDDMVIFVDLMAFYVMEDVK